MQQQFAADPLDDIAAAIRGLLYERHVAFARDLLQLAGVKPDQQMQVRMEHLLYRWANRHPAAPYAPNSPGAAPSRRDDAPGPSAATGVTYAAARSGRSE
jgi:hypothetical protein